MIDRSEIESDPEQVAVYHLLLEAWHSPVDSSSKTLDAARQLHSHIQVSLDQDNCAWGSVYALNVFLRDNPIAIDFGIDVFRALIRELPESTHDYMGVTAIRGEDILRAFLFNDAQFFQAMRVEIIWVKKTWTIQACPMPRTSY